MRVRRNQVRSSVPLGYDRVMGDFDHYQFWYYGCLTQLGHHFFLPGGFSIREPKGIPTRFGVFGIEKLLTTTREGEGQIFHEEGWTVFMYPDQSLDRRPGSLSAFVARGDYDVDAMLALAMKCFPTVLGRRATPVKFGESYKLAGLLQVVGGMKSGESLHIPLPTTIGVTENRQIATPEMAGDTEVPSPEALAEVEQAYSQRLETQEAVLKEKVGVGFEPIEAIDETPKERMPDAPAHATGGSVRSVRRKGRN